MKNSPDITLKIANFLKEAYKGPIFKTESSLAHSSVFPHLRVELEAIEKSSIPRGMLIKYAVQETPFGHWLVAIAEGKLCAISFLRGNLVDQLQELSSRWNGAEMVEDISATGDMIKKIFDPTKPSDITVLVFGTPFQISVWKMLLNIRNGSVVSYGDIAKAIGKPRAVRAVGTAVGANPIAYLVPCHRVITGTGNIGQYF